MKRAATFTLVILSTLAVAACGLRGDLERPEPLWGNPADYEQEQRSEEDDEG
ncbi:lipoprotein [Maricaulis sp.]|uniref:LPS translocon maturation chaperone LptM n=1 Tax=unclassified Maricaulis TaxID=2632371 RepID=UPI001B11B4D0|nr:lipoprotein [Maricaulis sp.]MBO6796607.1 lipoprotein [Maricaulis sp.]